MAVFGTFLFPLRHLPLDYAGVNAIAARVDKFRAQFLEQS